MAAPDPRTCASRRRSRLASEDKARFPYMPFYVDDWLSSGAVASFTMEQQAAYFRLLIQQWKAHDGQLPKDETVLAGYSGLGSKWRKVGRPIIQRCFVERSGGLVNVRLREIWLHVRAKSKQAKAAAGARWSRAQSDLPDMEDD